MSVDRDAVAASIFRAGRQDWLGTVDDSPNVASYAYADAAIAAQVLPATDVDLVEFTLAEHGYRLQNADGTYVCPRCGVAMHGDAQTGVQRHQAEMVVALSASAACAWGVRMGRSGEVYPYPNEGTARRYVTDLLELWPGTVASVCRDDGTGWVDA